MAALLDRFGIRSPRMDGLWKQYGEAYALLREGLEPEQRKLLLRLADRGNTLRDEAALYAFLSGYRLAEGIHRELDSFPPFSIIAEDEERGMRLFEQERRKNPNGRTEKEPLCANPGHVT